MEFDKSLCDDNFVHADGVDKLDCITRRETCVEGQERDIVEVNEVQIVPCPYVGMEFVSENAAYEFYATYSKSRGFGIRRNSCYRSKKTKTIMTRQFVCDKHGKKNMNDKRQSGKDVKRRKNTRENCTANMLVGINSSGEWVIRSFNDEHSHALVRTPSKVARVRSHHQLSPPCKRMISTFHDCRLGPGKISRVINETTGIPTVTPKECTNILRGTRINNVRRECMAVVKYFQDKQISDPGFFFKIEVDESNQTRSVFWADSRSRSAYLEFGDLVVFDVTYKTDKFSMPFAPLTGVNHHRQSTLFGCALLADETEATFTWLFETWLKCMWGKHPISIITDQDMAMGKAIGKVLPNTCHRLCSWNIGKNASQHLGDLRAKEGFNKDYDTWMKRTETIEEFENGWENIKVKYEVCEQHWLAKMYSIRHQWVSCYLKDTFFAGMSSSQQSESINSFFDGFVNARTPLDEFVCQYDKALVSHRVDEEEEDFKTMYSKPVLSSEHPLEIQAGKLYTRVILGIFQEEFRRSHSLLTERVSSKDLGLTYSVGKHGVDRKHVVSYMGDGRDGEVFANCSCKMFEHEGILCRHILKLFLKFDVIEIPSKFILHRWTINARHGSGSGMDGVNMGTCSVDSNKLTPLMMWSLRSGCLKIADYGSTSLEKYRRIYSKVKELQRDIDEDEIKFKVNDKINIDENGPSYPVSLDIVAYMEMATRTMTEGSQVTINDPKIVKAKGLPRRCERLKSGLEVSLVRSQPKQRTCSVCYGKGHYMTTCPLAKG
ncbi:hypothetical protein H6P81_019278 [Aristolochia fimbriata]|uniref:SWIM-type domain-containing protein n=1 Tax=Aristolochia fimbriata TaxID=158543 RepID=A0AAV7DVY4_ARIFI|nr:hypothetical protein H6P81_019278 [Aristolochia fimbriata]